MSITNGYATLAQLRSELGNYGGSDTSDDAKMEQSIEAASRQIDGHCGWRFWQDGTAQAREFYVDDTFRIDLTDPLEAGDIGDGISTVTGLVVKVDYDGDGTFETTLTINTDFLVKPRNAATRIPVWPYTSIEIIRSSSNYFPRSIYGRAGVQVTAKFGWPAVPDDIEKACLIQAADLFKAKDAAFGVAGVSDMGVLRVKSGLNATARALVADYRKPAIG